VIPMENMRPPPAPCFQLGESVEEGWTTCRRCRPRRAPISCMMYFASRYMLVNIFVHNSFWLVLRHYHDSRLLSTCEAMLALFILIIFVTGRDLD
jgi:hypothetical protein